MFSRLRRSLVAFSMTTLVLFGGVSTAAPAIAADLSTPPSLMSFKLTSPSTVYERDELKYEFEIAGANASRGSLIYSDSLGKSHIAWLGGSIGKGAGSLVIEPDQWPVGKVTLQAARLSTEYGSVSYDRSGNSSKYPEGMKDPLPANLDFAAMDFTIAPLHKYPSIPTTTVSGDPVVGSTLTASTGPWTPSAGYVYYRWRHADDHEMDLGSYSQTYLVTEEDAGRQIVSFAYARTPSYEITESKSAPTATVVRPFTATAAPAITGQARVGSTLSATSGTTTPTAETTTYAWKRNGVVIAGATSPTLVLTGSDAGKTITVTVTVRKPGYAPHSQTSTATATILNVFTYTPRPTISGTTRVGQTLTASSAAWSPTPSTMSHTWLRNGVVIPEATATTYKLVAADAGAAITVRVTARRMGYAATSKLSNPTAAIANNLITAARPIIARTAAIAQVLSVKTGVWSPDGVAFTFQWKRNGAPITGATGASYKVMTADVGTALSVTVTGRKSGYVTKSSTSYATAPVTK